LPKVAPFIATTTTDSKNGVAKSAPTVKPKHNLIVVMLIFIVNLVYRADSADRPRRAGPFEVSLFAAS
jgi:hypothetical protein